MPKAEKVASDYLKEAYPDQHLKLSTGVYETSFGRYLFDVKDASGGKINQLIIRKELNNIEDTNRTKELNEKVKTYISSNSNLSFEKIDTNGTVFFLTNDQFKRLEDVWIILTGKELSKEKLADFGKSINNWSKENRLSLHQLTIDYTNVTSQENYRFSADKKQLDGQNYLTFIQRK
jgi:hypothetical protein